jgi:hypothetical protein
MYSSMLAGVVVRATTLIPPWVWLGCRYFSVAARRNRVCPTATRPMRVTVP